MAGEAHGGSGSCCRAAGSPAGREVSAARRRGAAGRWVGRAWSRTGGMQGILLLVYVNGLMFVMRHFAGPLVHKLSPIGVLWCSCLGASLGLVGLSFANSPA